jgi:Zn-dependent M28 family amino/carboxypeptidase
MGLLLFFTSWRPVPGAFDNLSAVSVVAGLGQYIGEAKRSEVWFPERTEVVLLATSSEEAGHRGAKRYVKRHLEELKRIPTYGLFLEMIKDEKHLAVWKGESSTGARHDPELIRMAQEVATSHNWPIFVGQLPVLLTTDADSFSLNGIAAVCLTSCDPSKLDPTYHTRNDTYEHVRPESLSVMLQLVIDMIQRIDESKKI